MFESGVSVRAVTLFFIGASDPDACMCGAIAFIDIDQYIVQTFNNNRVFYWTCVPTIEPCSFHQRQCFLARILTSSSDEYITVDIIFIEEKFMRDILEGSTHLHILPNYFPGFLSRGASGWHLHPGHLWWNDGHSNIYKQFALEHIPHALEGLAMRGIRYCNNNNIRLLCCFQVCGPNHRRRAFQ